MGGRTNDLLRLTRRFVRGPVSGLVRGPVRGLVRGPVRGLVRVMRWIVRGLVRVMRWIVRGPVRGLVRVMRWLVRGPVRGPRRRPFRRRLLCRKLGRSVERRRGSGVPRWVVGGP